MSGEDIRKFFRDLFGSRLISVLEAQLLFARADTDRVRLEYQQIIAELRQEKALLNARLSSYDAKAGLRPPSEVPKKPNFGVDFSFPEVETSWQKLQREHEERNAKELKEEAEAAKNKPVVSDVKE